jgi:hypothetical protein
MNQVKYGALLTLLMAAGAANAQEPTAPADDLGPRVGFLGQVDLDYGGDDVATVYFEDDDSQNVKAGQGLAISVGAYFRPIASSTFEIDASVGYKFSTTAASNADIGVERTMLQLGVSHRWPNGLYLGGGLVHNMGPTVDGDGFFEDIDFDDAQGFNLEVGWRWIALHYTDMTYESDLYEDVDASHFGLRFTYRYGQH